jgi:hypothetical protein
MTKAAGTLGGLPGRRFSGWLVLLDDIGIVLTSGELLEPYDLLAVGEIASFALISSSISLKLLLLSMSTCFFLQFKRIEN